jgi:hypothetical protein
MVRRAAIHRAVLTLTLSAFASAAAAQGLGDAARRAEERRKTSRGDAIVIDKLPDAPSDSGPPRLSEQVLDRYLRARMALADLRRADKSLDRRIYNGRNKAKHYDDLEPVYNAEPDVAAVFSTFSLTPTSYLQIEAAIYRGRDYANYRSLSMERLSPRDRENVEFVKARLGLAQSIFDRAQAAERGLLFYGWIPSVH